MMINMSNADLESLGVDINVLPGTNDVLLGFDAAQTLNRSTVVEYRRRVIEMKLYLAIKEQLHAFATSLEDVVGRETIRLLSPQEWSKLVVGFGNACDDSLWSYEAIQKSIHPQNGYTRESPQVKDLIEVLAQFEKEERELFVKFLTGSKSLPRDGFAGLKPDLTVVKAVRSADEGSPDMFLPSVMTCANFIKLPEYSSKQILKSQLKKAIHEGQGSFLLS